MMRMPRASFTPRTPEFIGEVCERHCFSETLFNRELQILAKQSAVDVFLIRLDDRI